MPLLATLARWAAGWSTLSVARQARLAAWRPGQRTNLAISSMASPAICLAITPPRPHQPRHRNHKADGGGLACNNERSGGPALLRGPLVRSVCGLLLGGVRLAQAYSTRRRTQQI